MLLPHFLLFFLFFSPLVLAGAWSADITVNVENVDEPPQQEVCEVEEDLDDEVTETFDFVVVATGAYRIPQVCLVEQ